MKLNVRFSPLHAALLATFTAFAVSARAADIEIKAPPGGKVLIKDATGATTPLIVDGAGPVTLPGLPASTVVSAGVVCFDANGTLAKCAPIIGAQGPVGPAGPIGAAGASGTTGATGTAGFVGGTGAAGTTGIAGPIGPVGATGLVGANGAIGPMGGTGAAGPTGIAGPAGAVGTTGPVGATGAAGAVGGTGATGATGIAGQTGPTGATGMTGTAPNIRLTTYSTTQANDLYGDSVTATCGTGVVISGGCEINTLGGPHLAASFRSSGNQWTCVYFDFQRVYGQKITTHAYCM